MASACCSPLSYLVFTARMFGFSRQHPLRRILVAMWACWFVVLLSEPAMLHSCPMHDGAPGSVGVAEGHTGHHGSHAANAAVDGSRDLTAPDQGAPQQAAPHACTCIGDCSASTIVVPTAAAPMSWLAGIIDIAPVIGVAHQSVPAAPDFVLPFANGPPLMSWSRSA